ncbi:MAG: hypothetical protein IJK04_02125 [Kiritimatiellae bacterium]|nr:hypothetical protein [Kiritimatiellia bacterium]MBQ6245635.1 hypothetical protein [Kiritimatiellia bacterium]
MCGVTSKINPVFIVERHFKTFGDAQRHGRWKDVLLFYVLPTCLGLLAWRSEQFFDLEKSAGTAINVLAIFVPLAFSVLTALFSFIDCSTRDENDPVRKLATDLYWNVSYGIVTSMIALCFLVSIEFLGIKKGQWFAGVFVMVFIHFLFTALMVIKRFAKLMDPARQ